MRKKRKQQAEVWRKQKPGERRKVADFNAETAFSQMSRC